MSRLNSLIKKNLDNADCFSFNCIPGNLTWAYLALAKAHVINWCEVHDRDCLKCGMNQNNLEKIFK